MVVVSRPGIARPVLNTPHTPQASTSTVPESGPSLLRQALGNATTAAAAASATVKPLSFEAQEDFIGFDYGDGDETVGESASEVETPRNNRRSNSRRGTPASASGGSSTGRKRKRDSMGDALTDEGTRKVRLREAERKTPWSADVDWDSDKHPTHLLNDEARSFMRYISPTVKEHEMRLWTIELVRRAIVKKWKGARVECFGSVGTGLYLPGGDIDLVILCDEMPKPPRKPTSSLLHRIAALLLTTSLAEPSSLIVIAKARVPIVKFTSRFGGFSVDISINQKGGLDTAVVVRKLLDDYSFVTEDGDQLVGVARSLTMMVKMFLNQRGLNEVFTGGLGSYAIMCMVISFIQVHPRIQTGAIDPAANLGLLFLEFLELYGKHFNYDDVGITIKGRGGYFYKDDRGWLNNQRRFALCIEDPTDPTNDISAGSFNILQVRGTLAGAFDMLSATIVQRVSLQSAEDVGDPSLALSDEALPNADSSTVDPSKRSILGSVIGLTSASLRHRRANEQLYDAQVLQRLLIAEGGELPSSSLPVASLSSSVTSAPTSKATSQDGAAPLTKKQRRQAKLDAKRAARLSRKEAKRAKRLERKVQKLQDKEQQAAENMEYIVVDSSESDRASSSSSSDQDELLPTAIDLTQDSDDGAAAGAEDVRLDFDDDAADEDDSRYAIGKATPSASKTASNASSSVMIEDSDSDSDSTGETDATAAVHVPDYVVGGATGDRLTAETVTTRPLADAAARKSPAKKRTAVASTSSAKSPAKKQKSPVKTSTPLRPGKKERDAARQQRNDFWVQKGPKDVFD